MVNEHALARERVQHAGDALAAQPLPDIGKRDRLPRPVEQGEHGSLLALALPQRGKVGVRYQGIGLIAAEPQPGRQHDAHAVEIRAVQPLAHPGSKFQLLRRQNRRIVQHLDHGFELVFAGVPPEPQHDRFRPFIAKAERHENTGADLHLFPQLVRHAVGI